MPDLPDLSGVSAQDLTDEQIRGILSQIDLDILNLVRDGKLSALKYAAGGGAASADRAANLMALLAARDHYQKLLASRPAWSVSQADCNCPRLDRS